MNSNKNITANFTPLNSTSCTNYTYTEWSECINKTQTRTILTSLPTGCTDKSTAILKQPCTPGCTENWECTNWSECTNGTQTKE